ncbi:hypothetical protein Fmac_019093 [Flemingia macrophylla]|uniref:Terpene synthase N-terminal domain-containing protein n=1 Tax=Flemingia macrophylla TaxID=520843 RepID=A0ABD1M6S7_9FABA
MSDVRRPCVSFPADIWGDTFLQLASNQSKEVDDNVKQQAQSLKENVKMIFKSFTNQNIMQNLKFIDLLQRFGISYEFQHEIDQALEEIHNTCNEDDSHHSPSLLFRLLRQQGYEISSSIFNKLKDDQGNFNETLANNIQGLCDLYEAAHLRTHKDDILEEAYNFSKTHLEFLANNVNQSLAIKINHCLKRPFNKSLPRFEARFHMIIYEQDSSHNETLLTFAEMHFDILQKMHQKEIGNITKWWRKSTLVAKVPYVRDRVVKTFLLEIWKLPLKIWFLFLM